MRFKFYERNKYSVKKKKRLKLNKTKSKTRENISKQKVILKTKTFENGTKI